MRFSKRIAKITRKHLMPKWVDDITEPPVMLTEIMKQSFIDDVKEYQTLSNRRWYRKRELEKSIVITARYWLKDIEKIQAERPKVIVPIRRFGKFTKP